MLFLSAGADQLAPGGQLLHHISSFFIFIYLFFFALPQIRFHLVILSPVGAARFKTDIL